MDDKEKEDAKAVRESIRLHMKAVSELLVKLSALRGGDGYEFNCNLNAFKNEVKGSMAGQAFVVKDGQLEYLPDARTDAEVAEESKDDKVSNNAAVVVEELLKRLGLKRKNNED